MKEKKETKRAPKKETEKKSEKDPRRLANGNFSEGNTIGEGTRFKKGEQNGTPFKKGHTLSKKYKKEYSAMLLEYFRREDIVFPTLEGFVEYVRSVEGKAIDYATAEAWARGDEKYAYAQQFQEAYRQAKAIQREKLIYGGLTKKFDPSFSRFIASSMHDMKEKTEQKVDASVDAKGAFTVKVSYFEDEEK